MLVFVFGVLLSFYSQWVIQWEPAQSENNWRFLHVVLATASNFLAFFGPVLFIFCAVLAWTYQVGSARLGVIDLFACEISTLCRIATILDTVRRQVDKFEQGRSAEAPGLDGSQMVASPFTSQENYFPVFESNAPALQTLEARVVINITAFYTYMKAVRDTMRTLTEIRPLPAEFRSVHDQVAPVGPWHETARNIVYMLFLGLESAREAINDLVEFEPELAERKIVILISELEAYRFLRGQFKDNNEVHHRRIALREPVYRELWPELRQLVTQKYAEHDSLWKPAWLLLDELEKSYDAAVGVVC